MPYFHMRVIKSVSLHSVNTAWLRLIFLQQLELRPGDFTKQTHLKYGDFMDTWSSQKQLGWIIRFSLHSSFWCAEQLKTNKIAQFFPVNWFREK